MMSIKHLGSAPLLAILTIFANINTFAHAFIYLGGGNDKAPPSRECTLQELYDFTGSGILHHGDEAITLSYSIVPLSLDESTGDYKRVPFNPNISASEMTSGIKMKMEYEHDAWISVGVSPTVGITKMVGSQVIVGLPEDPNGASNPGKYDIASKLSSGLRLMSAEKQTLIDASVTQTDVSTTLEFTKVMKEEDEYSIEIDKVTTFIWAVGASTKLGMHRREGGFSINPAFSCANALDLNSDSDSTNTATSTSGSGSDFEEGAHPMDSNTFTVNQPVLGRSLWIVHGVFASLAWVVAAPLAVMAAIFRYAWKSNDGFHRAWFRYHYALNMLCAVFTFISFFTAVGATVQTQDTHFDEPHKIVGLVLFLALTIHTAAAMYRPDVGKSLEEMSKPVKRVVWEYSHRGTGILLIGTGIWQVQSGLNMYGEHYGGNAASGFSVAFWFWFCVLFLVSIYAGCKGYFIKPDIV